VLFIAPSAIGQSGIDHYALPFGNQPFTPSRASLEVPGFLKASDFAPAQFCGKCHTEIHREWRESAHSNSFREPFYLKNVEMLIKQKGIEYSRHCEGCHNPVALLSGALTTNSTLGRPFDNEGITCQVCHSIAKIERNEGTGSYVMGQPAVMLNPDGTPRPGIPSYSEIFDNIELHKKAVMKDFLRTPEFCSVCHKAAIPKELDGYKWLRAFSVYDEWQQSSWSKQSPLPFYQKQVASGCQACHMPFRPGKNEYGAIDGQIRSHRFIGANSAIPTFYSYSDQLSKTQEFLKDTVAVDIFGLTVKHKNSTEQIYPLGSRSFDVRAGDELTVDVVIQNTRAGHSLVPEQRDFYQSWVECIAKNERGEIVFHSGGLDSEGSLDPYAHSYTNRLIDRGGRRIDHHEVWQTRLKTYDNTILPGRSDLVRFRFRVPSGRTRRLDIAVRVNYRRFRKEYTDFILAEATNYPVFELGSAHQAVNIGKNTLQNSSGMEQHRSLLRWNNYGIALLGQEQWWAAANAFHEVTKLDPNNADGFINEGIAELSRWVESRKENSDGPGIFSLDNANAPPQAFASALGFIQRALENSPNSARALFYRGVIFRLQNRLNEAIADFLNIERQYPRFRQVRDELGYAYYLKTDFSMPLKSSKLPKLLTRTT